MRKVDIDFNKVSLFASFVAVIVSVISLFISIKVNNNISSGVPLSEKAKLLESQKPYIVPNISDTVIVRKDGSRVEIKSYEANDKLNGLIAMDNEPSVKYDDKSKKTKNKNAYVSDRVVQVKPLERKIKSDNNVRKDGLRGVKAKEQQEKKIVKKNETKEVKTEKVVSVKINNNTTDKYIIQVGSFDSNDQALVQCNKVEKKLNLTSAGKRCLVESRNQQHRAVISYFTTRGDAENFTRLLAEHGFQSFIRKN